MSVTLKVALLFCAIAWLQCQVTGQSSFLQFGSTVLLGEKQYYIEQTDKVNWYAANQDCATLNMSLTSIESEYEYKNLSTYLFANDLLNATFWLSGSNLAQSSQYTWLATGNSITYSKWIRNQPGTTSNRCVTTDTSFAWTTAACTTAKLFICSRPKLPACGVKGRCLYKYPK